jgi:hypothetical protein
MAVRVRKLAKELERSPWDVLGMLHALGFGRYRSPEDMLPDSTCDRVRRGWKDGVTPLPVERPGVAQPPRLSPGPAAPRTERGPSEDLMARLVPGVIRNGPRSPEKKARVREPQIVPQIVPPSASSLAYAADPEPDELEEERARLAEEAERLENERATLVADRQEWATELEAWKADRLALKADREALAADRRALRGERATGVPTGPGLPGPLLVDLLQARGLRGSDEFERALGALAAARQLGDVLGRLAVLDPEPVERLIRERLVLVGGGVPDSLPPGMTGVTVAPDRAELPDAIDLHKRLARTGELFLLNGLRRVLVVGGRPVWQRMLRQAIDGRVEMRFLPAVRRTRADAEGDVTRTDAVILWNVEVEPDAREVYRTGRSILVDVEETDLSALLDGITSALTV